ncbi:MAG: hypothetical protein K8S55_15435 [Phycisphaerae bacterium]|nr:hypothetical protein [Phycisphaerae bacterium]
MIAWTIFYNPMTFSPHAALWLVLPVCLAVAMVYRTLRIGDIRQLPIRILALWGYIIGGLALLGGGFWLLLRFLL